MRPITSTYRRKDGSKKRTYVCRHVVDCTGLCDAPPIDAELIDTHVVNELQNYIGDFEGWRDQLLSGYSSERQRLEREVAQAVGDLTEQERICERIDRAIGLAETDADSKAAMRAAANANKELERCQRRVEASRQALSGVPDDVPTDAMLDFYNELSAAVRGRLQGASTLGRVNDALKDIFQAFILEPPPHVFGKGIFVIPLLKLDAHKMEEWLRGCGDLGRCVTEEITELEQITPPLRTIEAPSRQLANAQESWHPNLW